MAERARAKTFNEVVAEAERQKRATVDITKREAPTSKGEGADLLALIRQWLEDPESHAKELRQMLAVLNTPAGRAALLAEGETTMEANKSATVQDLVWSAICTAGAEIRKRKPELSEARARDEFMRTEEGRELVQLHRDPDSRRTLEEFKRAKHAKAELEKLGAHSWDAVLTNAAKDFAAAHGVDFRQGLKIARERMPHVVELYELERRGQL